MFPVLPWIPCANVPSPPILFLPQSLALGLDMTGEYKDFKGVSPGWTAVSGGPLGDGDQGHLKTQPKWTNCLKLRETVVESLESLEEAVCPLLSRQNGRHWFCIKKSSCNFSASSWTPTLSVQDVL